MLFNSYNFILYFLPIVIIGYLIVNGIFNNRVVNFWVIICSLYFYSWAKSSDIIIILSSIIINYIFARSFTIYPHRKKILLVTIIFINISILVFYKYLSFINTNLNHIFPTLKLKTTSRELPLAISFFTFQQISFVVDRYRKQVMPVTFEKYSAAVVFFPHLIAGPLVEYKRLIPQFNRKKSVYRLINKIHIGVFVFILGLSKKLLIADQLVPLVENVFNIGLNVSALNPFNIWLGVISYSLQLYFDFSGYSDMAIGLGLMFGIILPANFNSPYKSLSIIDFWRRWHISLSNFLRDYLYIPLGGSRGGVLARYQNLFLTMLIGGTWHGAGWNFIFWGAWHGSLLSINHLWRWFNDSAINSGLNKYRLPLRIVSWTLTYISVLVGWVFFRSSDLKSAVVIIKKMFTISSSDLSTEAYSSINNYPIVFLIALTAFLISIAGPNSIKITKYIKLIIYKRQSYLLQLCLVLIFACVFVICLLLMSKPMTFIYYQF